MPERWSQLNPEERADAIDAYNLIPHVLRPYKDQPKITSEIVELLGDQVKNQRAAVLAIQRALTEGILVRWSTIRKFTDTREGMVLAEIRKEA